MKRFVFLFVLLGFACSQLTKQEKLPYSKADFEKTIDGKQTTLYTLKNRHGIRVDLTNFGARIVSIIVPDRMKKLADICLGFKSVADDQAFPQKYGAVIGPYANRIGGAKFELNGEVYHLPANDHGNCLHSGPNSYDRQVFDTEEINTDEGLAVRMTLHRKDGDSGFPGNKVLTVTYTLTNNDELKISYEATTDKACPINLTNHASFNLKGTGQGDVLSQIVVIDADSTTEVNDELVPTGKIIPIKGTDMDFTSPHTIGERINSDYTPMKIAGGYDQNYILNKNKNGHEMTFAASVYEPVSGRFMEVFTTEPAIQFYTGNSQDGSLTGKYGHKWEYRDGMCFETQHYPDSPNHPNFPNTILEPGDTLRSTTIYKFSVK